MKIGILGHGLIAWGGGVGLLSMMTHALAAGAPSAEIHIFLPLGEPSKPGLAGFMEQIFNGKRRAVKPVPRTILEAFATIGDGVQLHVIEDGRSPLKAALKREGIGVALPAMSPLPPAIGVPWVGYIYDFQHRYLPEYFDTDEIHRRDLAFEDMTKTAKAVVVNSRKVKSDIGKYIPDATAKIFALPFTPFLAANRLAEEGTGEHRPSAPYFIICNQFWVHKDHRTAFRAFAIIASEHKDVTLMCTGDLNDYRAPEHMPSLIAEIDELGIAVRVKLLGMIAKAEQMRLVRNSLALIQPTLFEGGPGGGAVYDAVALGVPALVSDIEVNREVDCGDVRFFEAGNPEALAQTMRDLLSEGSPPRPNLWQLQEQSKARLVRCGQALLEAVAFVSGTPKGF
ncbi:MAG TPA: glycosyltransferase [Methylocella sp.]|nr:glycosyltransferase [Methylocella sp.]